MADRNPLYANEVPGPLDLARRVARKLPQN